jgi:hypothetical protein
MAAPAGSVKLPCRQLKPQNLGALQRGVKLHRSERAKARREDFK